MTRYSIVVTIDTNHEADAETVCRLIDQEAVFAIRRLRRDNLILTHTTLHRVDPTSLQVGPVQFVSPYSRPTASGMNDDNPV